MRQSTTRHSLGQRSRYGVALIYIVVAIPAFLGLLSLAVDSARVRMVHDELMTAAETAARYAVQGLSDGTSVARAISTAAENSVDGTPMVLQAADVTVGVWDCTARTFTATNTSPNAVRVVATRSKARGNAVPLVFLQSLGLSSYDSQATVVAFYTNDALLVVGNIPLNSSDVAISARLTGLGLNVVVVKDTLVTATMAQYSRVVFISETVVSGYISNRLKDVSTGCVVGEPLLFDEFMMAGPTAQTDHGFTDVGNNVDMVTTTHALSCGLTGTVTVTTRAASVSPGLGFGVPSANATVISNVSGRPGMAALFCYDTGAAMYSGYIARGRRVGFFCYSPSVGNDGAPANCFKPSAWSMFDASIKWALLPSVPVRSVQFSR